MRRDRLDQTRTVLARIWAGEKIEQRMRVARRAALLHHEGTAAGVLGHQLHGAVDDRVAHISFARQRRVITRRPARLSTGLGATTCAVREAFCSGARRRDFRRLNMRGLSVMDRLARRAAATAPAPAAAPARW